MDHRGSKFQDIFKRMSWIKEQRVDGTGYIAIYKELYIL